MTATTVRPLDARDHEPVVALSLRAWAPVFASLERCWVTEQGRAVALVSTGGDPGHAPARRLYERAGFTALPIVHYFTKL